MVKGSQIAYVMVIVLLLVLLFNKKPQEVEVRETTTIEYVPVTTTITDTKYVSVKPEVIKVPVINNVHDTIYEDKEVKKYEYEDNLENGIIKSTIYADNIYKRDVTLKTFDKVVTTVTEITVVKSMLFVDLGTDILIDKSIKDVNFNFNYTHKNKWRIGVGGGYDFIMKDPFVGVKFGIPLN